MTTYRIKRIQILLVSQLFEIEADSLDEAKLKAMALAPDDRQPREVIEDSIEYGPDEDF